MNRTYVTDLIVLQEPSAQFSFHYSLCSSYAFYFITQLLTILIDAGVPSTYFKYIYHAVLRGIMKNLFGNMLFRLVTKNFANIESHTR